MKSVPVTAVFSSPLFAIGSDFSARFIFAQLIGRIGKSSFGSFARSLIN
jgi:hypothetical protein